jgi:hypothetical protein
MEMSDDNQLQDDVKSKVENTEKSPKGKYLDRYDY